MDRTPPLYRSLSQAPFRERWQFMVMVIRRVGELDPLERAWLLQRLEAVHMDTVELPEEPALTVVAHD